LKSLELYSHATEVIKYGPQLKDIEKVFKAEIGYNISVDCQFCHTAEEL